MFEAIQNFIKSGADDSMELYKFCVKDVRFADSCYLGTSPSPVMFSVKANACIREYNTYIQKHFIITFEGKLSDESLDAHITNCTEGKDHEFKNWNLIPYINTESLDDYASKFLLEIYPKAYNTPAPLPVEMIAERLGLKIVYNNEKADGAIYFENDPHIEISLNSKKGRINNTIIHECVHWFYHHNYLTLQHLLNEDPDDKTRDYMEWQANNLTPRILMPKEMTKQKVESLLAEISGDDPFKAMEETIAKTATFFGTSIESTKYRLKSLGYTEAEGVWNYNKVTNSYYPPFKFNTNFFDEKDTFILDKDLFEKFKTTSHEFEIFSSWFEWIEGRVVLNDPKYVRNSKLTEYALNHVDECCLRFKISYIKRHEISDKIDIFYRNYDYQKNVEVICDVNDNKKVTENLLKVIEEWEGLDEYFRNLPNDFSGTLTAHMKRRGYTNETLAAQCYINPKTVSRYRNGENVTFKTLLSLCIGLNLLPNWSYDLIKKAGHEHNIERDDDICATYRALINESYTENINVWNKVLWIKHNELLPNNNCVAAKRALEALS